MRYSILLVFTLLLACQTDEADKPELLTPNTAFDFTVDLIGTANVFQPGHRIRVDITSSNFPLTLRTWPCGPLNFGISGGL